MRFSEKKENKALLETTKISPNDFHTKFWHIINQFHLTLLGDYEFKGKHDRYFIVTKKFFNFIWNEFFPEKISQLDSLSQEKIFNTKTAFQFFQEHFFNCPWFTIFDIIEAIDSYNRRFLRIKFDFGKYINDLFQKENIDFSYINNQFEKKKTNFHNGMV